MDGGDGGKAEEEWKTKTAQQTKNKLDGEGGKGNPKRRKLSNEGLLDSEGKMDENLGEIITSQNVGNQAFISQLQEEIQTKDLSIQALQFENQKLRQQQHANPQNVLSPMEKKLVEQYKMKILEYQSALSQRDQVIGSLQTRLAELVQQRDEVVTESTQQTESFGQEIETLKLQLQEATDALSKQWVTGVNPREHMLLKHKLIAVEKSIDQDRQLVEELTRQLTEKSDRCNLFELKYKQCLQKCKQLQIDNEDVKNRNKVFEAKIEQLQHEKDKSEKEYESEIVEAREKISAMTKDQQQTTLEVQSLMKKLQEITMELQTAKEDHESQLTVADERLGNEITLIKQKISEQHSEEILKIEYAHKSELAQVQQQIDALEKLQKEDHAKLLENLEVERGKVQMLESLVQQITKDKEDQLLSLKEEQESRLKMEEQLNLEWERVRDLNGKNEMLNQEIEDKRMQIDTVSNELAQSKYAKDDMNVQIQSVQQKCSEVTEKLSNCEEECQNLKLRYDELVLEKENWLKERISLNAEIMCIEKLNEEVAKLEVEVKAKLELERKLITIQTVQGELEKKCESYEKEISALQCELEKKNLEVTTLNEECEQIKVLSSELAQSKADKENMNNQIQDMEQNYNGAKENLEKMLVDFSKLSSEYEELKKEKEKWCIEKESLMSEVRNIEILKEEVMKFQEEAKMKLLQEQDLISLKERHMELEKRCEELENYEKCNKDLEADLKKKCLEFEELKDQYLLLKKEYEGVVNADWVDNEMSEESSDSSPIKVKVNELVKKLKETDKNLHSMESTLKDVKFDKESLLSEMDQLRKTCDSMEKQKNETESELEKMMDQYKMMEAELVNTRLALDREVQLATHQRLTSDVGASVTASLENCAVQTSSISSGTYPLMDNDPSEQPIFSLENQKDVDIEKEKDSMAWKEKYLSLDKSKKECDNEIEKLKIKTHDQHFAIQSLENIKSKLSRRIEELEKEKKTLREDQQQLQKFQADKIENLVKEEELKSVISKLEEKLRQMEEHMIELQTNLQNLVKLQSPGNPVLSQKIEECLEFTKIKAQAKPVMGNVRVKYIEVEELHIVYEEYRKCLSNLQEALDSSDTLNKENLETFLENAELKNEIQKLKASPEAEGKEEENTVNTETMKDSFNNQSESASTEMGDIILRHEIERLKTAMNQQQVRSRLENLLHQSPKLHNQEEQCLTGNEKQILNTLISSHFKQILEDWEDQARSEPGLAGFISSQSFKIHSIIEKLDDMIDSPTSQTTMEIGIKFLRDAVIKTVKSKYVHLAEKLVLEVEKTVTNSLQSIFPSDVSEILDVKSEAEKQEIDPDKPPSDLENLSEKVESLINARSVLVDSVAGFEEELGNTLTSQLSSLNNELERMVKNISSEEKETDTKHTSPEAKYGDTEYNQFIQEFLEIAKRQFDGDQAEKLQLLESQKMMVNKILEDNKAKLDNLCHDHINNLNNLTSLPDAMQLVNSLVNALENTLSYEVSWVEQQYKELLEQYAYEQNLVKQTYSQTLNELVFRLESLLKERNSQNAEPPVESHFEDEMMKMKEDHAAEVAHLENQLAARDNEALRHLQSLYSDRDWYKKTVGLLSHVTLQLLHYYSVAENYTHKSHTTPAQPESLPYEMTSGKVLDLSFLSDCVTDDNEANQYNIFPEDSAVSTGLIGKTIDFEHCEEAELGSNAESMLDSTGMSEGMLDDMDKDEQVRKILTKSYPQLMSILKGRWDRVIVDHLEKEVQELTIALQASAGMLKIFMHSVTESQDLSSHTVRDESVDENKSFELTQYCIEESEHASNLVHLSHDSSTVTNMPPTSPKESLTSIENTEQLSKLQLTSLKSCNLEDLSQSLTQLLSHDESFLNLTKLKPQDVGDEAKLKRAIIQLCKSAEATDNLQLKLHHLQGLLKGCEEEKIVLEDEIERLNHYNKNLAMELQTAKDQMEELELMQQNKSGTGTAQYAAKMEASKDIRERVRAVLSAKNKSLMNHTQLVSRVGELEGILEALVRESDAVAEKLKAQVSDLSQQLEVADRQLRSSRQFLEEHASERDQEVDDLVQVKEKLQSQLREKDAVIAQHANLEKEVENLERDLREKSQELQDALALKEELLAENKTAVDKIWDLRDIIQSLEAQLDAKCVQELEVNSQVESLKSTLAQAQRHSLDLTQQLEEAQYGRGEQSTGYGEFVPVLHSRTADPEEEDNDAQHASSSLFDELTQKRGIGTQNAAGQTLLQVIEERLDRTTKGLEALQLSISSASQSDEDLSVKDHLDVPSLQELEESRALSPSTLDRRLEDKLMTLERTTEAAVKRTRDLEMTVKNLRLDLDEAIIERDALQERSSEQLVKISSLEARLDELRRSDHPMAAEMRQRFTVVQEQLEQRRNDLAVKGRELEELRFNFNNLRTKLLAREEELERLMSTSQPHSLPQSSAEQLLARHQQLEDELTAKTDLIEKLKREVSEGNKETGIPLSYCLLDDKNAEISSLNHLVQDIKAKIIEVALQLSLEGNVEEAVNMLRKIAGGERFYDAVASSENRNSVEVLRREPEEVSPGLTPISVSTMKDLSKATLGVDEDMIHPNSSQELSLLSVQPEALKVPETLVEESLSASTELRQVLDDVIEGAGKDTSDCTSDIPETSEALVTSGKDEQCGDAIETQKILPQKRLEEDYRVAQDLLEAREEEITQLSEEIEDVLPQPLPSEAVQLQEKCYKLVEQHLELQGKLENLETDYEEEKKWRQELEEKLVTFEREREKIHESFKETTEKNKTTEMELRQAKLSLEEMVNQLQQMKQKYTEQSVLLHCKEEELIKVNSQVDQIQLEMKEKLSYAKRELTKVEHQYQQEILEVKEEQIVREKQLCSDYEERMADQVSDLTKLVREKEETISQIRHYYESQLKETLILKDEALKKVTEWREKLRMEEASGQSRDISRLCDSLEELKAGVAQEVNKSDQLDTSLVSYLKQGQEKENAGRSNRASSAVSDISDEESGDVINKVQKLMMKVHQEGVQVLTLIELMFLQKHQSHLNTSQRSLISQTGLLGLDSADNSSVVSREVSPRMGAGALDSLPNRERTQLLRRMANLEEELTRKEKEMNEKVEQMEFRLEQEKIAADEVKLNNDADKRRMEKMSEQLHQERLLGADQISEITFLRSQHAALQIQVQKLQDERNNLRENLESVHKQIETLRADLQAERANFSSVSKVLNQQRRLSSTTKNQQNQVIKDLRDTLEREREKILNLRAQLNEGINRQTSLKSNPMRSSSRSKHSDVRDSNIVTSNDDFKMQLAIEQGRLAELQRAYDKEVMKVLNLTEQLRIERASSKALLMEEQGKSAEFTKLIRNLEGEKDKLKRQMSSNHEKMQHQEARIRELEADVAKLESELKAQAAAHEMASHRVREGDAQLHSSYTSVLNKLGEAEAEVCSLRLKNNLLNKDLELAREKEMQLHQELTTEKMAINRLGLPALAKINNLNEYFELQLKENVELCKSVLRLTDNRHSARLKIVSLEATISDLTEQLIKANAAAQPSPSPERILQNERSIWETERSALQSLISRKDAELMRLRRDSESRLSNQNFNMQVDDSRVQYIYGKYLRSESWRKALVYQKKYLLVVLRGYEATEQNTYSRLNSMAERVYGPLSNLSRPVLQRTQPNNRFRVLVFAVIASCRMRFMVQRWKRSRRLGSQILLPNPPTSSVPPTPEPTHGSRPDSAASGPVSQVLMSEVRLPYTLNRPSAGAAWGSITGHTPPTKESSNSPSLQYQGATGTRRSLFAEQESASLDEYIERLGNIHSKLGLTPKDI